MALHSARMFYRARSCQMHEPAPGLLDLPLPSLTPRRRGTRSPLSACWPDRAGATKPSKCAASVGFVAPGQLPKCHGELGGCDGQWRACLVNRDARRPLT